MLKIPRITVFLILVLLYHCPPARSQEVDPELFQSSRIISVEISRKLLKKVYSDGGYPKTLHCGCVFDKIQQVYPANCDRAGEDSGSNGDKKDKEILGWVHGIPASSFAKSLKCWNETLCRREDGSAFKGAGCCRVVSHKYKTREADMHNLFPAIAAAGEEEDDDALAAAGFGGMDEYRFCRKDGKPALAPVKEVQGDLARAYFYMAFQYKFPIPEELEEKLRQWHLKDPPDNWEEERNSAIEIAQGNRNPFIDQPELVERVRDF